MSQLTNNSTLLNNLLTTVNELPNAITIDTTLTQSGQAADAKAVGDKVGRLDEEIAEINEKLEALNPDVETTETVVTTYKPTTVEDFDKAFMDVDGNVQVSNGWRMSPYLPMAHGDTVEFKLWCYPGVAEIVFFDKSYGIISAFVTDDNNKTVTTTLTAPEGTAYMRFSMIISMGDSTVYVKTTVTVVTSAKRQYLADEMHGKILSVTGDSITAATYSAPGNGYAEQIANRHEMLVENKAIWGAVFASGIMGDDGTNLPSILDSIETMRTDADYIIISGGINDAYQINSGKMQLGEIAQNYNSAHDTTTFCGAFEATLKRALLKWPGKKILFVIEHRMNTGYTSDVDKLIAETVYPKMVQMLHHWGVSYVDLYHDMPSLAFIPEYRDSYTFDADGDGVGDGWHPTSEGYALFYVPRVEAGMRRI